jgi:ribosomal protein S18 acetylase RimI-like enzyme
MENFTHSTLHGIAAMSRRRRNVFFLLGLSSLWNVCESFTVPFSSIYISPLEKTKRTWLKSTETESPPEIRTSAAPHESSYLTTLAREALIMANGDGAVESTRSEKGNDVKETNEEESEEHDEPPEDEEQLKRLTAAAAAALLRRKRGGARAVKPLQNKSTSVGARRVGSASRARASQRGTSKIMDTVRTVAAAAASSSTNTNSTTAKSKNTQKNDTSGSVNIGSNMIQATISSLLEGQKKSESSSSMTMNSLPRQFGILGDEPDPLSHELLKNPMPGTVLLYPTMQSREYQRPSGETLSIRVATPEDDFQISHLRLSVFSDFSSELRSQFCARSCQVLADRRLRGATCLVATCPSGRHQPEEIIVGSVECSVHEFYATKLGQRRPKYSILYITEVAVSPSARRCGVGSKLLEGIDELAALRNVESLYLHVDVLNFGALELYRKAGYRKVHHADPTYDEFTTSLNLHDGATKGRRHYLLYKNLTRNPTWLPVQDEQTKRQNLSKVDTAMWASFENVVN